MLAPTARPIPAGEWRLGLANVIVPNAGAGLGRGVSLGAGVVVGPEPIVAGVTLIEPKVTLVNRPALAVAVGATARFDPAGKTEGTALPYAVATVGAATRPGGLAATLGVGARVDLAPRVTAHPGGPYIDPSPPTIGPHTFSLARAPVAFAGLELRVSERVTLLAETGALPNKGTPEPFRTSCYAREAPDAQRLCARDYILSASAAVRYATRRVALDGGLTMGREEYGSVDPLVSVGPWLNVTFGLGS
ncbi:MAG: hypothetical protein Rubg2KO_00150 [Rubricoccaceae bacterium]